MSNKIEFYKLIGMLATRYSDLEYRAIRILENLIDHNDTLVGGIVASDISFLKCITLIAKISKVRFAHSPFLRGALTSYCKRLHGVRGERNLFVHGLWDMEHAPDDSPIVVCQSMRWKSTANTLGWMREKQKVWHIDDLKAKIAEINILLNDTHHIEQTIVQYMQSQNK